MWWRGFAYNSKVFDFEAGQFPRSPFVDQFRIADDPITDSLFQRVHDN